MKKAGNLSKPRLIFETRKRNMKYIQSFYQYPITLSSTGVIIPARSAQGDLKNICEVTEAQLDRIMNAEPFFRELVSKKKLRVLNHLPESYKSSAARINEAQDEIARLRAENEKLKAQKDAEPEEPEEAPAEEKPKATTKKTTSSKKKE